MFELVPFKKAHLDPLLEQNMNSNLPAWVKDGAAEEMEKTLSVSGFVHNKIMVCGGIIHLWPNRGYLWSIFSETSKFNFIPVFRGIQKFLDRSNYKRLEMSVELDCPKTSIYIRRASLLGFELECKRAKHYLSNGQDCALYVRIKR